MPRIKVFDPEATMTYLDAQRALRGDSLRSRILTLRLNGDSYDKICETLGVPLGTVKSNLNRAYTEIAAIKERTAAHENSGIQTEPAGSDQAGAGASGGEA